MPNDNQKFLAQGAKLLKLLSTLARRPTSPFALLCQCAFGFVVLAIWFQPPLEICLVVGGFVIVVPLLGLVLTKKR